MPPGSSNNRKRQQQICFRSLALPPSSADSDGDNDNDDSNNGNRKGNTSPEYCPHFLAALQLIAHTLVPVRKALVHFYVSYRNKDVDKLEWLTLLSFGRLFRGLITASQSSGSSVISGESSSVNTGSLADNSYSNNNTNEPVSSERFFPVLYTCLLKHDLQKWPTDATEAVRVLLDCLKVCSRTLPVTNQLWSALLDKACLGLIVKQSLVGRRIQETETDKEVKQRSYTEQCILWCPHEISIHDIARIPPPPPPVSKPKKDGDDDDDDEEDNSDSAPTLLQLMEADFRKRPLSTTSRSYYDFDKKSYDFEVQIPTKFLDQKKDLEDDDDNTDNNNKTNKEFWKTTRSMQFASLTGYLFIGIDRNRKPKGSASDNGNGKHKNKFDRSELSIPSILDLTKLCSKKTGNSNSNSNSKSKTTLPQQAIYDLVGGALYDEGESIAVLKDFAAASIAEEKKLNNNNNNNNDDSEDDEEDETWNLMEHEENIPMSESDVLEFLKGEGNDSDDEDDDDDEHGPCGTLAVYKLRSPAPSSSSTSKNKQQHDIFDEMNQLLSDIVISQVSGSLNSKTDFYIEEEIYEEEIIE